MPHISTRTLEELRDESKKILSSPIPCGKLIEGTKSEVGEKERVAAEKDVLQAYGKLLIASGKLRKLRTRRKLQRHERETGGQLVLLVIGEAL